MDRLEAVHIPDDETQQPAVQRQWPTRHEPTLSKALAELSRLATDSVRPWAIAAIAICLALISGMAVSAYYLAPGLFDLRRGISAQTAEAQKWTAETSALKDETKALKDEVESLRQIITSASNQDLIFLKIMLLRPKLDETFARNVARYVHKYAELHEKDPNLVLAIIEVESAFNPRAVSGVGAMGLMQVMPQWKRVLSIQGDLDDPETSIRYGLQVLSFYTEMYKDLETALTAYNRGPGPVDAALMRGKDPKNGYPTQVLATYQRLKRLSINR